MTIVIEIQTVFFMIKICFLANLWFVCRRASPVNLLSEILPSFPFLPSFLSSFIHRVRSISRLIWIVSEIQTYHFSPFQVLSSLILSCLMVLLKIIYKSTLTVKLSLVSITSSIYFLSILYSYFFSANIILIYSQPPSFPYHFFSHRPL